jgi:hypothetical protein
MGRELKVLTSSSTIANGLRGSSRLNAYARHHPSSIIIAHKVT